MRVRCLVLFVMCVALTITGCGQAEERITLEEPLEQEPLLQKVVRRDVGAKIKMTATVCPTDYGQCYDEDVCIASIEVEKGSYVRKGDVLAIADEKVKKEELEALQEELEWENVSYHIRQQIAALKVEQYPSAEDRREQEKVAEDARYDRLLHEYHVRKLNEQIDRQNELLEKQKLRADHSGYVTYVKNLMESTNASAKENIVVVSDMEDTYLELPMDWNQFYMEKSFDRNHSFAECKVMYALVADERIALKAKEYSIEDRIRFRNQQEYPMMSLECEGLRKLKAGESYPVFFMGEDVTDVIAVEQKCVYTVGQQSFVYVCDKDGQKQRRSVQTGAKDDWYVAITEGLWEGEMVYNNGAQKEQLEENVQITEWKDEPPRTKEVDEKDSMYDRMSECCSPVSGRIVRAAVTEGDSVEKGDLLFVVETENGKAALSDIRRQIEKEEETYRKQLQEQKEQTDTSDNISVQISNLECQLLTLVHERTIEALKEDEQRRNKNNDGTGNVSIYARQKGIVKQCEVQEGSMVEEQMRLCIVAD